MKRLPLILFLVCLSQLGVRDAAAEAIDFGELLAHMLDRIPFQKSVKLNMELMHWRSGGTVDYATTTYWYARDGANGNGQTSPARVRRRVAQSDADQAPR